MVANEKVDSSQSIVEPLKDHNSVGQAKQSNEKKLDRRMKSINCA